MSENRRPIIVVLNGGYGNQLFQLAAGLAAAQLSSRPVVFDVTLLQKGRHLGRRITARNLEIADLLHESEFTSTQCAGALLHTVADRLQLFGTVREQSLADKALLRITEGSRRLTGYFQDAELVEGAWPDLLARMTSVEKYNKVLSRSSLNRIAVHMRYGDYLKNPQARAFHGLTKPSFFTKAVRELEEAGEFDQVLLVSDDPKRAIEAFSRDYHGKLDVEPTRSETAFDDFVALSVSRGIVASNSSFSWWAGWIGHKLRSANVVAPEPWYASVQVPASHLIPKSWLLLEREFET